MNVTELARKLRVSTAELRQILPELGFDIGMKAIKVDDRTAQRIIKDWRNLLRQWQEKRREKEKIEETAEAIKEKKKIELPEVLTVRDFAQYLNLPVTRIIEELMKDGILASLNERIDFETAAIVAEDLGFEIGKKEKAEAEIEIGPQEDRLKVLFEEEKEKLVSRPPVVVILGHVDHGKTKLLDTIRQTHIMETEAGGITQHIGAYQLEVPSKGKITFIDTPGHEAFMAMRSRGARIADIAVLVVAADDSVQPQTREAHNIIKAAKLPLIVAITKIDKPEANIEKVKRDLSELGLVAEDWGGKTICAPVSAKTKEGIDDFLNMILLVAQMEKEKIVGNPDRFAAATIIESHIDKNEGAVATVLVQTGTLKKNDYLGSRGVLAGRVRKMEDWRGKSLDKALPSTPVKILGLKFALQVGDILEAQEEIGKLEAQKQKSRAAKEVMKAFAVGPSIEEGKKTFNIVLKADVLGSLEAILESLEKFSHPEVACKVISRGLGNITEADVLNAEASKAEVFGFHVAVLPAVEELARAKGVNVKIYTIIYDLFKTVKDELEKLLVPEVLVKELGRVKILAVFRTEAGWQVVGGRVEEGKVLPESQARVKREGRIIEQGKIVSLQIGKRDVSEANFGQECGLKIKIKSAIEVGDVLEVYQEEKKEKKLNF